MDNKKNKTIKVKKDSGEEVEIVIKKPTSSLLTKANRVGVKVWTEAVRDGLFTKLTLLDFMYKNGLWDEEKDSIQNSLTQQINQLEKELALGVGKNGSLKVSEGKEKAILLRALRIRLRDLIAEKIALEANTAEGLSDNSKFNFLVANSTFYTNGEKVFSSLTDYEENADDEIAFSAASAMGEMIYGLDSSYEENLPENQFLLKFNLVNSDLALIDNSGNTVDIDGTRVNDLGWLVNKDGHRIDRDGNLLSEKGQLLLQANYENDLDTSGITETPATKPKAKARKKPVVKKQEPTETV
jgi:hypothetical protein